MDDRLVAVENQLDKGISHRCTIFDTSVQASLWYFTEWKAKSPLLPRDERIYRVWNSSNCYTGDLNLFYFTDCSLSCQVSRYKSLFVLKIILLNINIYAFYFTIVFHHVNFDTTLNL